MLYERIDATKVHCFLCNHHCRIADSHYGFCGVRQNKGGALVTKSYGNVIASHVDPIEKKPLYHFLPGSTSYSIATPGCNFRCGFCQNWQISQAGSEGGFEEGLKGPFTDPAEVVRLAKLSSCPSISYTYTEPTIFFEYAYDTAKLAHQAGLANVFVTNGFMTAEALETITPYLDAANVDLKSFSDQFYKETCKGRLQPVLDTIKGMKERDIWVEVTTLVIPGFNDDNESFHAIADFLSGISVDIPWHLSRFHPDYKFTNAESTPKEVLTRGYEIAKRHGLRYVYLGNIPEGHNTECYQCGTTLVKRSGYGIYCESLTDGRCPVCHAVIAGRWSLPLSSRTAKVPSK